MPTKKNTVLPPIPVPQPEIEMIRSYLKLMPKVQQEHKTFRCEIAALVKYNETCAKAAVKLAADLKKCK